MSDSTNLDRLNKLLQNTGGIPFNRREVDRSGNNLKWLRKKIVGDRYDPELVALINMSMHELTK